MSQYRGYTISFDPKPIPSRDFDFDFSHEDYDGPGDHRCGSAGSVEDCMILIDEQLDDECE